jgi:hypothetical protein
MTAVNAKQRIMESSESNHSEAAPSSEAMRLAFSRVCIQSFAKGDLSMHRSQQWVKPSITTLMFALASTEFKR